MTKAPAPSALHAAVAAIRGELDKASREIDALVAQRESVASAAPHPSDLHEAIDAWVDAQAARYRKPLHELLAAMIASPLAVDGLMLDSSRPWFNKVMSLSGQHERLEAPAVAAGALALVAGDAIRSALKAEADALLAGQATGLPLAERRAKLAELDARITEKRAALESMKAEAAAAGLSLA